MNAKATHVIACLLLSAGQVLQFLDTNPALAQQLHITATILTVAGFLVALASQQLFGTPIPPAQTPIVTAPSAVLPDAAKSTQRGLGRVELVAALALGGLLAVLVVATPVRPPMVTAQGCGWLSGGGGAGQVAAGAGGIGACVIQQATQGVSDPGQVIAACAGATLQDVVQIVESLIAYYTATAPEAGPSPSTAALYRLAASARAKLAGGP